MNVGIFASVEEASCEGARIIREFFYSNPSATLGVATGSTPEPLYAKLRDAHAVGQFDLSKAKAFALDEYVGLDPDHPESYRNVLRRNLVGDDKTGLTEEGLNTPDVQHGDPHVEAAKYDAKIRDAQVDLQILGLGADGHIGFNEPGGSLVSRTHVEVLAPQTIKDNARFFGGEEKAVPSRCITQGLGTIMEAKKLLLFAFGKNKADAVRELVEGSVSAVWPATIIQLHPDVTVLLDQDAARYLRFKDLYQTRWELVK